MGKAAGRVVDLRLVTFATYPERVAFRNGWMQGAAEALHGSVRA